MQNMQCKTQNVGAARRAPVLHFEFYILHFALHSEL